MKPPRPLSHDFSSVAPELLTPPPSTEAARRSKSRPTSMRFTDAESEGIRQRLSELSEYEVLLERMASVELDEGFREELGSIENWFVTLSDYEQTTALYGLLKHASPVQIRFFSNVLQSLETPVSELLNDARVPESTEESRWGFAKGNVIVSRPVPKRSVRAGVFGTPLLSDLKGTPQPSDRISSPAFIDSAPTWAAQSISASGTPISSLHPNGTWTPTRDISRSPAAGWGIQRSRSPLVSKRVAQLWANAQEQGMTSEANSLAPPTQPLRTLFKESLELSHPSSIQRAVSTPPVLAPRPKANVPPGFGSRTPNRFDQKMQVWNQHVSKTQSSVAHREKGKIPEVIKVSDMEDIGAWLKSLRLHKYAPCFEGMNWKQMVVMNDEQLEAKGVAALGARRKLLKVFELVVSELKISE